MNLNTLKNGKEKMKNWGAKALATAGLFGLLSLGTPAQAQTTTKQQVKTEQVEKQNAPDMIAFAKKGLDKYFPEEKSYFDHIFDVIEQGGDLVKQFANKNLDSSTKKFTNEKDRVVAVLMAIELANQETKFFDKYKTDDFDERLMAGYDFLDGMKADFTAKEKQQDEKKKQQDEKKKQQDEKKKQQDERLSQIKAERQELVTELDKALLGYEKVMQEVKPEAVKNSLELQKSLKWYKETLQELQRDRPERKIDPHLQKLVDQLSK